MIFQTEKSMEELGDKLTDADKAPVNDAIAKLKETVKGGDTEAIKADTEALQKAFYPIAEKIYKEQAAAQGAGPEDAGDGNVYGADFEDKT
jgi:molecular chaperone DnaK